MGEIRTRDVLVIAAHPDDEVLGVGGTIARHTRQGARVSVLIMTDGVTARHSMIEPQRAAARNACRVLGVRDLEFVDLPDQRLDGLPLLDVIQPIAGAIREWRPQVVYTHHGGDVNQDHRTVFAATLVAVRPCGDNPVKRVLSYAVATSTEWAPPLAAWAFLPNVYTDIQDTLEDKLNAFEAYRKTFQSEVRSYPDPRSPEAVRLYAEATGVTVGLRAAEGFMLIRELVDG